MTTDEHLKRIEDITANTLSRREQWNDVVESLAAIREQIAEMERQRDQSAAETAAALEFLSAEMDWECFRADMLHSDDQPKERRSLENARLLKNYLAETGHGIGIVKRLAALTAERDQLAAQVAGHKLYLKSAWSGIESDAERIATLEAALHQIAEATSEPGIAARARAVLPAEVRDAELPTVEAPTNREAALRNCYMLARRQLRRGTDKEAWGHIVRFCESAGLQSSILRDAEIYPSHPVRCPYGNHPIFVRPSGSIVAHYSDAAPGSVRCKGSERQYCDCHLHETQVCDICQGVTGNERDEVQP